MQVPNVAQTPTRRCYAVPMEIKQKSRAAPPCPNDPQRRSRHCKHRKFGAQRVSTAWRQTKNVGVAWQAGSQRTAARAGTIPAIAAERVAPIVLALCATPSTMTFKLRGARSARIELHYGARPATDLSSEIVFAATVPRQVPISGCSRCRPSSRRSASVGSLLTSVRMAVLHEINGRGKQFGKVFARVATSNKQWVLPSRPRLACSVVRRRRASGSVPQLESIFAACACVTCARSC